MGPEKTSKNWWQRGKRNPAMAKDVTSPLTGGVDHAARRSCTHDVHVMIHGEKPLATPPVGNYSVTKRGEASSHTKNNEPKIVSRMRQWGSIPLLNYQVNKNWFEKVKYLDENNKTNWAMFGSTLPTRVSVQTNFIAISLRNLKKIEKKKELAGVNFKRPAGLGPLQKMTPHSNLSMTCIYVCCIVYTNR